MSTESIECLVIGGGVVGLAIARELANQGREVVILEANTLIGEETSSRNNEVIHAGFLYPPGSIKERMCVTGRQKLYEYCREKNVGHRKTGKLLPATNDDEADYLRKVMLRAHELGMTEVQWLSGVEASAMEPALQCQSALYSPESGIVDSHGLMLALRGDAESAGAMLAVRSRALSLTQRPDHRWHVEVDADGEPSSLVCDYVVNAAGLGALALSQTIDVYPAHKLPQIYYAHGCFFSYQGRTPFGRLIMPVGKTLWGGGAFTLDMANQGRFGPDLRWVDHKTYEVDPAAAGPMAETIRRYWPDLDASRLQPSYAGIRPRATGPGDPIGDWVVHGPADHGLPNLVALYAVETPGLTSCLATADYVTSLLRAQSVDLATSAH